MTTAIKREQTAKRVSAPGKSEKKDKDPWLAHEMSPHIPNAVTRRALEADTMPLPEGGLAELWNGE